MIKSKKFLLLFILIFTLSIISTACNITEKKPMSKNGFFLGTFCKITIYDKTSKDILDKAFNRINEIENKMTINKKNSEVININSKSGLDFVKVSPDTFDVIEKSLYYSQLSKGKFDISIGSIDKLWNIGTDKARVPSHKEIKSKIPLVNYKNIKLNKKDSSIMLKEKGMLIDLGGIAKGYVADEVKKVLAENGVKQALINLGGNVVTLGNKVDGTEWKIGIQDPFNPRGKYLGIISVPNKTIVTSGIYERYFEKDGKQYHHILDTKTGYPVDNSLVSVSIISDKSIDADALSTTIFSLGLDDGLKLVESLDNVDAIFVTKDYEIYISSSIKNNFKITNSKFKLKN